MIKFKDFKKKYNLTDKDFNIIKTKDGITFLNKNTEKEFIKKWKKALEKEVKILYEDKLHLIKTDGENIYLTFKENGYELHMTRYRFKQLQDAIFNVVFVVTDYNRKK